MLWTEAAFSACLAWHWPDHHWQCNWRVAWTSSHTYAGEKWTLRSTIEETIFNHMTRNASVFVKCDTSFRLFFLEITTISYFLLSQGSVATYWRYGAKYYTGFVAYLRGFPAVKEFWKSVKNWQSYRHEFGVLLFWDPVYTLHLHFLLYANCQAHWIMLWMTGCLSCWVNKNDYEWICEASGWGNDLIHSKAKPSKLRYMVRLRMILAGTGKCLILWLLLKFLAL